MITPTIAIANADSCATITAHHRGRTRNAGTEWAASAQTPTAAFDSTRNQARDRWTS
jgi:hypothetical protein